MASGLMLGQSRTDRPWEALGLTNVILFSDWPFSASSGLPAGLARRMSSALLGRQGQSVCLQSGSSPLGLSCFTWYSLSQLDLPGWTHACDVREVRGMTGNVCLMGREGRALSFRPGVRPWLWADVAGDPELLSILVSSPAPGLDRGPETEDT